MYGLTKPIDFKPMFKTGGKKLSYNDAPFNELLLVIDLFAHNEKPELDILGNQLLSGSIIVKLDNIYADRLSWIENQSLEKDQSLVYVSVGFASKYDSVSGLFNFQKVENKTLITYQKDVVGQFVLLKDLVYCDKTFVEDTNFSFESLGIV